MLKLQKVWLAWFAAILSFHITHALRPIVLVPGTKSSQIEARAVKGYTPSDASCPTDFDWFPVWFNKKAISPEAASCFVSEFTLVYNKTTGLCRNARGIETRVSGAFGNK
eukprot:Colp12_sorted_trinity150504_noHs@9475